MNRRSSISKGPGAVIMLRVLVNEGSMVQGMTQTRSLEFILNALRNHRYVLNKDTMTRFALFYKAPSISPRRVGWRRAS